MKIKKRLKLNTWISVFIVILMTLSLFWSFREIHRANRNEYLVNKMQKTAFERIALRDDYLLHRGERAGIQWHAKSEALRKLLDAAAENLTGKEEKILLQEARKNYDATFSIFSAILEKYKHKNAFKNSPIAFSETDSRLIGQVFIKSYALMDTIGMLHESTKNATIEALRKGAILIVFFFACGIIAIIINSMFLNKTVTKGVNALTDGIKIIGGGNLDYRITSAGTDELAELARAVNEMTDKLQQSYTSMENLQKEISRREKVEEDIKKLSLHQRTLLDAIPDIIMEVDANKIYTWANGPGIKFFGKDVIGKAADFYFVREQNTYDKVQPLFNGSNDLIYLESWQKRKDGQERLLAWWCHVLKDAQGNVSGALSSARDITDHKLAESKIALNSQRIQALLQLNQMTDSTLKEITDFALEEAVRLTQSKIGYLAFLNEDETILTMHAWSKSAMAECAINQKPIIYPVVSTGLWGEAVRQRRPVITNDYAAENPLKKGCPQGHVAVKRHMNIPVFAGNRIVLVSGVGNKAEDYDQSDIEQLILLMEGMWRLIERRQAEDEIKILNKELEQRVAQRTAELTAKTTELERINKVFVDRELRMRELKERIAELEKQT